VKSSEGFLLFSVGNTISAFYIFFFILWLSQSFSYNAVNIILTVCGSEKMSSGRTVGSLETWQPDDKSFNKHILNEGRGELTPNDESICIVHVVSVGNATLLPTYQLTMNVNYSISKVLR